MKKQSIFIFLMLISITAFGQKESDLKSDTTKLPMTDEAIIFCTEFEKPIPSIKDFDLPPPPPNNLPALQIPDSIYILPDELPTLAMFNHIEDYEIRQDSSIWEMRNFIYKNLRWPAGGPCVEGTSVISFIIEKDGSITNAKIIRDPGAGCGEEALRIVNMLPKFEAAKLNEKPVRYQFNLPIRFRLD